MKQRERQKERSACARAREHARQQVPARESLIQERARARKERERVCARVSEKVKQMNVK